MAMRIGIFICECGQTLAQALDIPRLAQVALQWDGVATIRVVPVACAPDAGSPIAKTIRAEKLDRVVFAGCSPREHEHTLRAILTDAGLNPYLMQIANIREGCAWTIRDRDRATDKAMDLIHGAVERVRRHRPLEPATIECRPDTLVVGAGVAGIGAARTLVQEGRRVFVVERAPCIGGHVALYEDLFPDQNCAACLLAPELDALLHDDRITLLTQAEVSEVGGYAGNFTVTVRQAPQYIDPERCIGCGACLEVCPASSPNAYNAAMDRRGAVYIPYAGALPYLAVIDEGICRRSKGASCTLCQDVCPFDAVNFDQSETTHTLSVGAIVVATGFKSFDATRDSRYGDGTPDVISSLAFERLASTSGPTGGSILTTHGKPPGQVALVHCVGSRSTMANPYCSGVCCTHAVKHAHQVKNQLPDTTVHLFVADLCLPGKSAQRLFDRLCDQTGVHLHRMVRPDAVQIFRNGERNAIRWTGPEGSVHMVIADLVVLANAMEPATGTGDLAQRLDIALDPDGFFMESHPVFEPVASSRPGIYLAGCCQGPQNAGASVAQGQAAAGRILQNLIPGQTITLPPTVAQIDEMVCSGCRTCEALCPYGAIVPETIPGATTIEAALCQGCGICAAACPSGAIQIRHHETDTIAAELAGLLASHPKASR